MKSDTERKRFHEAKMHQRTKRMHVHLSKELRAKLKKKKRSVLIRKGDKIKIMRGPGTGKTARVARVSHQKMKVYVEGVTVSNAKGRELMRALQPSNLLLLELEQTKERQQLFTEAAFKKPEKKPEAPKIEAKVEARTEAKPALKPESKVVKPASVEAEIIEEKTAEPEKAAASTESR